MKPLIRVNKNKTHKKKTEQLKPNDTNLVLIRPIEGKEETNARQSTK
jgi:hypothetical protein